MALYHFFYLLANLYQWWNIRANTETKWPDADKNIYTWVYYRNN